MAKPTVKTTCVYLKPDDGQPLRECFIHGKCDHVSCESCEDSLFPDCSNFSDIFIDHLNIQDRDRQPTDSFRNLLNGRSAFLICGGPSAGDNELELLNQRGVFSLAVNNMAGHHRFRPNVFVCSDPPSKFHNGIWEDPSIMKILPTPKLRPRRGRLRAKEGDAFIPLERDGKLVNACDSPNTWGFERRGWLRPDDSFFTEPSAAWGNQDKGHRLTGEPKTVCTMLLGLRLLYYLGCRRMFLLGVDFRMVGGRDLLANYAFDEERDLDAIRSNNAQFKIVGEWLCKMERDGVFRRFGLEVYNTYRESGLRAFPFVPFEAAVADVRKWMPEEPYDLRNWYKK